MEASVHGPLQGTYGQTMLLKPISQTEFSKEGATSNAYLSLHCQERLILAFSYVAPSVQVLRIQTTWKI